MTDIEFIYGEASSDSAIGKSFAALGIVTGQAVAADGLLRLIERIEGREADKKDVSDDIKDIYSEAKGQGYDTKILKQIIRLRRMEKDARDHEEALLDTYKSALGL